VSAAFRPEDRALLQRLEDEVVLEQIFRHHAGRGADVSVLHPRASGLVASARALDGGSAAVARALGGDAAPLARLLEAAPMRERPPELLHHLALYFAKVAAALERAAPDAAAGAWTRSIAAWIALGDERGYLARLEAAVLGPGRLPGRGSPPFAGSPSPEGSPRAPLDVLVDLGRRAESTSRALSPEGRAALLALSSVAEAARVAGASDEIARHACDAAERQRSAALDAALSTVGEALDEAKLRGELGTAGRAILERATAVWSWSDHDEMVERFVADRLATVGWELYRAHAWEALAQAFDPFRPMIESFVQRQERDPSRIAFAAPAAQLLVFLTDIERNAVRKKDLAERAVRICPTHRNARLNLASLLCDGAVDTMKQMMLFVRREELARVEADVARAEKLYPAATELPEAKAMLERMKRGRFTL